MGVRARPGGLRAWEVEEGRQELQACQWVFTTASESDCHSPGQAATLASACRDPTAPGPGLPLSVTVRVGQPEPEHPAALMLTVGRGSGFATSRLAPRHPGPSPAS
eukprot:1777712-Rhodomonas_salina.1